MHSATDRDLRLGVPPHEVFLRLLGRPPTASEIASLALAPATVSTLRRLELSLSRIADPLNLHYLHPTVVMLHLAPGFRLEIQLLPHHSQEHPDDGGSSRLPSAYRL